MSKGGWLLEKSVGMPYKLVLHRFNCGARVIDAPPPAAAQLVCHPPLFGSLFFTQHPATRSHRMNYSYKQ